MNLLWPPTTNFPKVMDPECKLKSPKSTVKKIIEAKESQKEQAHFTPTSPRKNRTVCPDLCPGMHTMAKMAKNRQPLTIWIGSQKWPLGDWRFGRNTPFSPKSPVSKGPLCHLIWIFVYSLAILGINRHFCHFRQCVHFWTYLRWRVKDDHS